jgi:hypothetical protein
MKLNSLLLLPAIIAVGTMPIVSLSLFDAQPAFSKEVSTSTPRPVEKKPGLRGSGSGSGPIEVAPPSPEEELRRKCQDFNNSFLTECRQLSVGQGNNPGNRPR